MKFLIGILGTLGLVVVLAGPLLLFSSLNPIAEDNLVKGTSLNLAIEVNVTSGSDIINRYNLFSNEHVKVLRSIENELYTDLNMGTNILTKNIRRSQMQEIAMSSTSDAVWDIAPPSQRLLFQQISNAVEESTRLPINVRLTYSFARDNPPGNQIVSHSIAIDVTKLKENKTIIDSLYDATNPDSTCEEQNNISFTIDALYYPVINLYENDDPEIIPVKDHNTSVTIVKNCQTIDNNSRHYWKIIQNKWGINTVSILSISITKLY